MRIAAILLASLALAASAQAPVTPVAPLFHPDGPLPSYEVATVKKPDPDAGGNGPRMVMSSGQSLKGYILNAYGASSASQSQIVGGPAWIGSDRYAIQGKMPDEQRAAMKTMTQKEQSNLTRSMQQSLLADRFKLKVHFEVRQLPIYELTAAKGGLKVKEVPAPPPFVSGGPPPPPFSPTQPPRPGVVMMIRNTSGLNTMKAGATTVSGLINLLRTNSEIAGRPILDKTGYTANFDVTDLSWSEVSATGADADGPSIFTALEESLGMKLTATKGPVEVIVIDSIERPSEN
jgi:uncharacterized protein (TIGR03435 family)